MRSDALPADVELTSSTANRAGGSAQGARAAAPRQAQAVLATSIAETSVTLDDVRIVVDSGLARRPR